MSVPELVFRKSEDVCCCMVVWNDRLFTGWSDGYIVTWTKNGKIDKLAEAHRGFWVIELIVFKNERLFSASGTNEIKMWNSDLQCLKTLTWQRLPNMFDMNSLNNLNDAGTFALTASEDTIYIATNDQYIRMWTPPFEQSYTIFSAHASQVNHIQLWRNYLCTVSNHSIKIWNEQYKHIITLSIRSVRCVTLWKDYLCSGTSNEICAWDFVKKTKFFFTKTKCVRRFKVSSPVNCMIVWHNVLLSGHKDGTIRSWSWDTQTCIRSWSLVREHIPIVSMTPWNDDTLCVGFTKGLVFWTPGWAPYAVSKFSPSTKALKRTITILLKRKEDGTPVYPECSLHKLPPDVINIILNLI
jgi:WD40 repeat protein